MITLAIEKRASIVPCGSSELFYGRTVRIHKENIVEIRFVPFEDFPFIDVQGTRISISVRGKNYFISRGGI
ncbi:MAG: hypothetical protein VW622_10090, partial [Opitutae bacterium]